MLKIEEIEVRGKRKAVVISTYGKTFEEDESHLLEIIWEALKEYEKQKKVKVTFSYHKTNFKMTGIVLVYP